MIWKGGPRGDKIRCLWLRLSQRVSRWGGGIWLETWTMKTHPAPAGRAFQAERRTSANVRLWGRKELGGFKICEERWGRLSSGRGEADGKVRSESGGGGLVAQSCPTDSLRSCGLQPTRLLCPWSSPGKNTGVGCHFLLPGIFLTQGSN